MSRITLLATVLAVIAVPAAAHHIDNLTTPYGSRGQCESAVARFSAEDRDSLLDRFPGYFDSVGDVASFLTRAFPCERQSDGSWYIQDHRVEILTSDWFLRK